VLGDYHRGAGALLHDFEATVERFAGDGRLTAFFNDPVPCADGPERAVRLAVAMRDRVWELAEAWSRVGHELHPAVGVAQGHATLGRIGFEGRADYAAIGAPTRIAELLCEAAQPGQILIDRRVHAATEALVVTHPVGALALRGLARPAPAFDLVGLDASAA
jgi:class 3 adenylate cyclase